MQVCQCVKPVSLCYRRCGLYEPCLLVCKLCVTDDVACTNPDYCMQVCQSRAGCSNIAYPRLVLGLMPDGGCRLTTGGINSSELGGVAGEGVRG